MSETVHVCCLTNAPFSQSLFSTFTDKLIAIPIDVDLPSITLIMTDGSIDLGPPSALLLSNFHQALT